MIQGIHHVCLKADTQENYTKAITFYTEVLGCSIKRQWDSGIMLDTGHGLIEIFNQADTPLDQGVIRHLALATDCVDDCVAAIQKAGYPIDYDSLIERFGNTILTRAHFARFLLEKGAIPSIDSAFKKILAAEGPYFVKRHYLTPKKGIELI